MLAATGRRLRQGPLTVAYLGTSGAEVNDCSTTGPAVAYAITRSVGSAVVRNRVRRRLRAAALELVRAGRWPAGDYLVSAGPAAADRSYAELRDTLAALTARVEPAP